MVWGQSGCFRVFLVVRLNQKDLLRIYEFTCTVFNTDVNLTVTLWA